MLSRRKTPEQEQAEFRLMCHGLFLFWVLAHIWPCLLILAGGLIVGAYCFIATPVLAARTGDLEAFALWAVIAAVFAFVGVWYVASVRRERRGAVPPPKLPIAEERKKAEALWKFVPEENEKKRPAKMSRAEKKKIAEFWENPAGKI